jgi:hypothetical protein
VPDWEVISDIADFDAQQISSFASFVSFVSASFMLMMVHHRGIDFPVV